MGLSGACGNIGPASPFADAARPAQCSLRYLDLAQVLDCPYQKKLLSASTLPTLLQSHLLPRLCAVMELPNMETGHSAHTCTAQPLPTSAALSLRAQSAQTGNGTMHPLHGGAGSGGDGDPLH